MRPLACLAAAATLGACVPVATIATEPDDASVDAREPDDWATSHSPFTPEVHPDPDRGGLLACWTRAEDGNAPEGGVYAAFLAPDGTVRGPTRLATFDTRHRDFLATCAPVPGSGGAVLVTAWLQRHGAAEYRVVTWTPATPAADSGVTQELHRETAPQHSTYAPSLLRAEVVGSEVWVPLLLPTGERNPRFTPLPSRFVRLRVDAADVTAGRTERDEVAIPGLGSTAAHVATVATPSGAWTAYGQQPFRFAFATSAAPATVVAQRAAPIALIGFSRPLAATDEMLGITWHEDTENMSERRTIRLAWVQIDQPAVRIGPRLPFGRSETLHPAAMAVGTSMYLVGSPAAPSDPTRFALSLYRVPFGAAADATVETVRTLARPNADALAVAAAAHPFADGTGFGLAWVELRPESPSTPGVRYALSVQRFAF